MSSKQQPNTHKKQIDVNRLADDIKMWGKQLGFQAIGFSDIRLADAEHHLQNWVSKKFHGNMHYMVKHGLKRSRPDMLIPGTLSIISVRMNYWNDDLATTINLLDRSDCAYISRYALGRDYHKVLRKQLKRLAQRIEKQIGTFGYRVFSDSAPVLEKAIAEKAGIGWIGKHSNLINRDQGSWFFLGEIYTDLELPIDQLSTSHCGHCTACIDCCPTQAIVAPYQVDATRCISYLTIELQGSIPTEFRALIGNRIYGCDDCQLFCPWNRFSHATEEVDFLPRHSLNSISLVTLFSWTEETFLQLTQGSAIRRIGYINWLRNIAVALGNTKNPSEEVVQALQARADHPSAIVREHVAWALDRQLPGINS